MASSWVASRLYPPPCEEMLPEEVYADLILPKGREDGLPYVVVNMVSTLDGRAAEGGKSGSIGTEVDRLLMRNVRCAVDAVLVGAGTLRSEEIRLNVPPGMVAKRRDKGLADQPIGVVLAGGGDVPLGRRLFAAGNDAPLLVMFSEGTAGGSLKRLPTHVRLIRLPHASGPPDPLDILRALKERFGVHRVLVEGGPKLNRSFLEVGAVEEIFLTLAPKITGEEVAPTIVSGPRLQIPVGVTIVSVHIARDELYLRYRLT